MNIRSLRKSEKKTQVEIAKFLSIAPTTYSGYELGTSEPTIETLCKLADYYHVSLDYLVGREFTNDVGFLTSQEKFLLENFRQLSEETQLKFLARIEGALITEQK